jgi:hypothetical protein
LDCIDVLLREEFFEVVVNVVVADFFPIIGREGVEVVAEERL